MNWRKGLRRIVKVGAGLYMAIAVLICGLISYDEGWVRSPTFEFTLPNGRLFDVSARDQRAAAKILADHLQLHPESGRPMPNGYEWMTFATILPERNASAPAVRHFEAGRALQFAGWAAQWWTLGFLTLWIMYRTGRWVVRGFLGP